MWGIFLDAAPYLFLGFGVAGLPHIFIPDEKIMDYLGASAGKFRSVINASIAFGLALDVVYHERGIATTSIAGSMGEVLPHEVKMIFAVLMLPMMAYATYRSMRTTHLK
jgi:hypothetical protein